MLGEAGADYDLFIIGGGINGCGIARDAAGRGLSVALAESGDLAQGTSSSSTKLIHGGLRYLEHYEFSLVRKALKERETLLSIAPHIVHPLRFILPHGPGMRPAWLLRIGLFLYDHLARRVSLPGSRQLDLRASEAGDPLREQYARGFEYSDCQVDDARLVILNARDAARFGAEIFTRTTPVSAVREAGGWRINLRHGDGATRSVTARMLVNAAGPWADSAAQAIQVGSSAPRLRLVQGAHIVTRRLFDHDRAYILQNPDGRIVFAIPYQGDFTLVGTTDTEFLADPLEAKALDREIDYLLTSVNHYFRKQASREDVVWSFAGVRALVDDGTGKAQSASREYRLDIDSPEGFAPLLTVLGGKLTSYRVLAEHVLREFAALLPKDKRLAAPCWTGQTPLPGGGLAVADLRVLGAQLAARHDWLTAPLLSRWLGSYGAEIEQICSCCGQNGDPGRHFGAGLHEMEVLWLMRNEWAQTAEDVVWRRSKLGLHMSLEQITELDEWMQQQR